MDHLRILIADDHPLVRQALATALSMVPDFEVVGVADAGDQAVLLAAQLQPDLILMDVQMPGLNGIEATRRVLHARPQIGILILTMHEEDEALFAALQAGARGYVSKTAGLAEIMLAVRAVADGEAIFSPASARQLLHYFATPQVPSPPLAFPNLTDREREILGLIACGHNNTVIAQRLVLSPKTVRNHISNIFNKLQVADRAEAIVRAREAGLGTSNGPLVAGRLLAAT